MSPRQMNPNWPSRMTATTLSPRMDRTANKP
jgi:hypothetical protein